MTKRWLLRILASIAFLTGPWLWIPIFSLFISLEFKESFVKVYRAWIKDDIRIIRTGKW